MVMLYSSDTYTYTTNQILTYETQEKEHNFKSGYVNTQKQVTWEGCNFFLISLKDLRVA